MNSRGGQDSPSPDPRLHGGLLALLVVLISCGVVAMHSLGVGHLSGMHTVSADLDPTMSVSHTVEATAPTGGMTVLVAKTSVAASVSYDGQGCAACAVEAAHGPDHKGGHSGLAMCIAVLSLLVYVVLRRRGGAVRTVPALTRTSARALTQFVCGPPHRRAPSLSELCICRT